MLQKKSSYRELQNPEYLTKLVDKICTLDEIKHFWRRNPLEPTITSYLLPTFPYQQASNPSSDMQ